MFIRRRFADAGNGAPPWRGCRNSSSSTNAGCGSGRRPQKPPVLSYSEGQGFNEEETGLLLKGGTAGELPAATREKLGPMACRMSWISCRAI
ncbi:MAG: hypothetical protein WBV22_12295 [Anaerolineaceae bacterium]